MSGLEEFVCEWGDGTPERSILIVNRTASRPVRDLVDTAFADQPVGVEDVDSPAAVEDLVVVVADGDVVATSPLADLMDAYLLINSDTFRTGDGGLDVTVPDVLRALDETVFEVRGYPASNKEKLLLTVLSRHVERRALATGAGTLRTLFQRLSRIEDEHGTRSVYDRLAATALDVHVYGRPDRDPPGDAGYTVHASTDPEVRDGWCAVFVPPSGEDGHVALVAVVTDDGAWRGAWTYDPERVEAVERYVATL